MTADKYQYNLVTKRDTRQTQVPLIDYILMLIVMIVASLVFMFLFFRALDIRLDRQHQMLCESAKLSGNTNVLNCK